MRGFEVVAEDGLEGDSLRARWIGSFDREPDGIPVLGEVGDFERGWEGGVGEMPVGGLEERLDECDGFGVGWVDFQRGDGPGEGGTAFLVAGGFLGEVEPGGEECRFEG